MSHKSYKKAQPEASAPGDVVTAEAGSLERLYTTMLLIRSVEERLVKLFADGEVPGFIHLSVGQEAVAAGVMHALDSRDTMATTHRGHGHVLARGMDLERFFKEIMGKAGGICAGRSGSMHIADMELGILGANGIVGAGLPIALGSALAHSLRRSQGVAVAIFGDGAMAEGALHETLNIAALWGLPLLFVCENNGWSEFSPTSRQFAAELGKIAQAFGIEFVAVDGCDVEAIAQASSALVKVMRLDGKPRILECATNRARGHFEGDSQAYRDTAELETVRKADPLERARQALLRLGIEDSQLEAYAAEVAARVAAAIEKARADAEPDFAHALADVYTPETAGGEV